MFYGLPGNYWLNIAYFEEMVESLYDYFKPIKYRQFQDENHLHVFLYAMFDKFFKDSKNQKYMKFQPFLKHRFTILIYKEDSGGSYCTVDSIYFGSN